MMTPLESNIDTVRKAAQDIEKQLSGQLIEDPDKIVELSAKMQRYINTCNLLVRMKAVIEQKQIVKPSNGLVIAK